MTIEASEAATTIAAAPDAVDQPAGAPGAAAVGGAAEQAPAAPAAAERDPFAPRDIAAEIAAEFDTLRTPKDETEPKTADTPDKGDQAKADAPGATAPDPRARFQLVDAAGKFAPAPALPDGTKIRFRADGEDVTVSSMDELVQHAQKGINFEKKSSAWGEERGQFQRAVQEAQTQVSAAEETILRALFDDDFRAALREEAERFRDPEFREGQQAKQELSALRQRQQLQDEQARAEGATKLWDGVTETFRAKLGDYQFLRAEDAGEAATVLHSEYITNRESLFESAANGGYDLNDPRVVQQIEAAAVRTLSSENLHAIMNRLNARYENRLGPIARQQADITAAETHNRRTDERLQRADAPRALRAADAAPVLEHGSRKPAPVTFEDRMADISSDFARLRNG